MHIKSARFRLFKRFTDLTIDGIPEAARLVVLCGPNGQGKSSVFDGLRVWQGARTGGNWGGWDAIYHAKANAATGSEGPHHIEVEFHEGTPSVLEEIKRVLYVRSAYRHEPDFQIGSINRSGSIGDAPRVSRLIDTDTKVSENYQRLVSNTVAGVYSGEYDGELVRDLRDRLIGEIRQSMIRLFPDLLLTGPGDPLQAGTFYFDKGKSHDFHYKNLSGGEKAAFDIILDLIARKSYFNNTVYCIDQPELHMNTRLQAALIEEMFNILPAESQLWVATHSIGMMRSARDLQRQDPSAVVFLDFEDKDFDSTVTLTPQRVDRDFWTRTLRVAFGEMASLVAPTQIVLCEGNPSLPRSSDKAEFDARCYRRIFGQHYPDTDFLSIGNASDVRTDRLGIGRAFQALVPGTKVIRVVDRDDRTEEEIRDLRNEGVRVLSRRHIEAFILDDEILEKLCSALNQQSRYAEVLDAKQQALRNSISRQNPADDIKSAAGDLYVQLRILLGLQGMGNTTEAFLRDTMAPLVTADTTTFELLAGDVFG